jgi:dTDP-glucose 4,6-dehydratase
VQYWHARHPHDTLVVLDALTYAGRRSTLAPLEQQGAITFVHDDIGNGPLVRELLATHGITHLVHFAAESHVDRSIAAPDAFIRTNVWGTHTLLEAARAVWCNQGRWREGVRFHHISTDEVFGALGAHDAPFTEASPYLPSSPYSASKAGADHLVRAAGKTYGLPYTITHCANNYGPYQHAEKLLPHMLRRALLGEPLPMYGDGLQQREWLHVHDHCTMLEQLLLAPNVLGESFNLAGYDERTNMDAVTQLCALLDARFAANPQLAPRYPACPAARGERCISLVTHVADRPGHDRRYALDGDKLRARLGVGPQIPFEQGLADTVDWYLAHAGW